jgi:hypothetical protein
VHEAYVHCSKHLPKMVKVPIEQDARQRLPDAEFFVA